MSEQVKEELQKNGLYAGNIILELIPDSKGVKPGIKVNELATADDIEVALEAFKALCIATHSIIRDSDLPITYEAAIQEVKQKKLDRANEDLKTLNAQLKYSD